MEEASPNSLEQLANLNPLLPLEQDQKDLVLGEGSWGIARNQEESATSSCLSLVPDQSRCRLGR